MGIIRRCRSYCVLNLNYAKKKRYWVFVSFFVVYQTRFPLEFYYIDTFEFTPDDATQKVRISFNDPVGSSTQIDFTGTDTIRDLLGYDSQILTPTVYPGNVIGDTEAAFNAVNGFLVHSNLITNGIRFNNSQSQVIDKVDITVPPGSLINQKNFNMTEVSCDNLAGDSRSDITMWITDLSGNGVNTLGEFFSCHVVISYYEMVDYSDRKVRGQKYH